MEKDHSKVFPENRLLDTNEVAAILFVSPKTIFNWRKKKLIPFYRLGDVIRYRSEDLEAFLAAQRDEQMYDQKEGNSEDTMEEDSRGR